MTSVVEMVPTARLFARLLLRELDAATLAELRAPEVAAALAEVGIELPDDGALESLQAEYFERLLHPKDSAPPIASLWMDGQYQGDSAVMLRRIAEASGWEYQPAAADGAPMDHLGSILLLWCECTETAPDLANLIAFQHLTWVDRALADTSARDGFYAQVCRATAALVAELREAAEPPAE